MLPKPGTVLILIFSLLFGGQVSYAQSASAETFFLDGLVYGYKQESSSKLLQREKQTILEGVLQGVLINVRDEGRLVAGTSTNKKGEFELKLPTGKVYRIEFSKTNYNKSILVLDLRSMPKEMTQEGVYFNGAEIILNSFKSKDTSQSNLPFGKLYYNTKTKSFDFEAGKASSKKGLFSKKEEASNAAYLMKRAVSKNKDNLKRQLPSKDKKQTGSGPDEPVKKPGLQPSAHSAGQRLSPISGISNYDEATVALREEEIAKAMQQLEYDKANALTAEDFLRVREQETMLNAAMVELENAKEMIELQKREISIQRKLLILGVFCLLLLSAFLFMLYRHNKERKRTLLILKENAKKISDSINYASRIQRSILLREEEVSRILPESFIYYQPRDVVSGDFYWISEVNGKIVVAAVDCTGHGVPGAFMSLIGNTLMNEIVNEKGITKPSAILSQMHAGILKALRQDADGHSQDGMDVSLCVIDGEKKQIEYAGAMNPVYLLKEGKIQIIKPDMQGIGGMDLKKSGKPVAFTDHIIPIEQNMSLYMFTDGYMDQFGGDENRKFNTARFKEMLLTIRTMSMARQKEALDSTMNAWKKDQRQIDDMLVIGIRF